MQGQGGAQSITIHRPPCCWPRVGEQSLQSAIGTALTELPWLAPLPGPELQAQPSVSRSVRRLCSICRGFSLAAAGPGQERGQQERALESPAAAGARGPQPPPAVPGDPALAQQLPKPTAAAGCLWRTGWLLVRAALAWATHSVANICGALQECGPASTQPLGAQAQQHHKLPMLPPAVPALASLQLDKALQALCACCQFIRQALKEQSMPARRSALGSAGDGPACTVPCWPSRCMPHRFSRALKRCQTSAWTPSIAGFSWRQEG